MKKYLISFIFIIFITKVYSFNNMIFNSYDPTYYSESDPAYVSAGTLTGVSDVYFTYNMYNNTMKTSQTEWLADGRGSEYVSSYDSIFSYSGITFEKMKTDPYFSLIVTDDVYDDLKEQAINYYKNILFDNALSLETKQSYIDFMQDEISQELEYEINQYYNNVEQNSVSKHLVNVFYSNLLQIDKNLESDTKSGFSYWGAQSNSYFDQSISSSLAEFSIGLDYGINKNFKMGFGYFYNSYDLSENFDFSGSSMFVYGRYGIKNIYLDSVLSFGNFASSNSDKDVGTFGGVIKAGYEFPYLIKGELGIRYLNIGSEPEDFISFVSGIKHTLNIKEIKLNTKLNLLRNFNDINGCIGLETGFNLESNFEKINIVIGYDFLLQDNMSGHTGSIKIKVKF